MPASVTTAPARRGRAGAAPRPRPHLGVLVDHDQLGGPHATVLEEATGAAGVLAAQASAWPRLDGPGRQVAEVADRRPDEHQRPPFTSSAPGPGAPPRSQRVTDGRRHRSNEPAPPRSTVRAPHGTPRRLRAMVRVRSTVMSRSQNARRWRTAGGTCARLAGRSTRTPRPRPVRAGPGGGRAATGHLGRSQDLSVAQQPGQVGVRR